ncbi:MULTISPECIES: pyridoxine 5'-phosphate synthase [Prochlorococcus]|uniref:Pyridoxine 5'-phosphate synthase n=1 Tax=Prochlorococcus marinus (strain SARG / CCMP1375 / SS120) TaxID=167539 RepID=PDXJ_PROMA|nr:MULTISPECIES: pyridoxine 5'-phosphate synthase [Prochlorococcus]Q7VBK3.1 RecName: Full=Pyridoxine 5'-phosphate synthase; Short=PNP synthase [Prochlorococcus marinus subsp. marinus str. CCMP1375]AAQ00134.1 Pyridoxal phosphate biosynthesis protein [Prochlorococcus marinus subsp. marinus str. CCMP1375]KGG13930.1 Pyridoxine 5'-phosphate synthase [Prochlorococcus marinus str. LG]KGG19063.1 Pyridoxine 5'-phosphate synthase [Prochlorococcus marinus str. SS2]KGG23397.1 Pyridoxine 5'-phosphate synth
MTSLGVNIDHIANIRQARLANEPDPVQMALLAELGGADGITIHLREDRRHIQDRDLKLLRETIKSRLNLEMAATTEMIEIALDLKPDMITLVPERREEITTEGGLDVASNAKSLKEIVTKMESCCIPTSLFVDANSKQLEASSKIGATWVELHTGPYARASWKNQPLEFAKISEGVARARNLGLRVNAGHGLTYQNVEPIASITEMEELNIGHTIIARAIAIGLKEAVKEMKELIKNPRHEPFFGS